MHDEERKVVCRGTDSSTEEVPASMLSFRPSVYGIIRKDDAVLLSREFGAYAIPGGAVEIGEPIQEALVREIEEETGLSVSVGELIHLADSFFIHPARKTKHHSILMYYARSLLGGELSIEGLTSHEKEWSEMPVWVPLLEASSAKFTNPEEQVVIKKYQMMKI
jgi:ADP-ribose pyrophosphatase YjhB (NUDIX family)